jgi:hypothetical protein
VRDPVPTLIVPAGFKGNPSQEGHHKAGQGPRGERPGPGGPFNFDSFLKHATAALQSAFLSESRFSAPRITGGIKPLKPAYTILPTAQLRYLLIRAVFNIRPNKATERRFKIRLKLIV